MQDHKTLTRDPGLTVETVAVAQLTDSQLTELSKKRLLSLSLDEMRAVQNYYRSIHREPTEVELETIAQTWSEHCKHKTFKGQIDYKCESNDPDEKCPTKFYDDLLDETVVKATNDLNKPFCLSVFEDNAGIISFDGKNGVAFKAETHNHPSALEPYGGSGTGIGGVIRDILGVGLGAKPVLNTDVFCVGDFGQKVPENSGMLPPQRILSGVIAGVRDYGNRMGIPTSNGAVLFNKGYIANPLVFCGTVGMIPVDKIKKKVSPGELVVSIGGRTGRDGIHGATFSSLALEKDISASVVQIGNAIVEKKVAEVILRARDKNLYSSLTDCGAGGFSSAVGELGSDTGVKVYLDKAPLKYEGLLPWEIWISESQERMVLAVPKSKLKEFEEVCAIEDVECSVIGEFSDDGQLQVFYKDVKTCDISMKFLHKGIPRIRKSAVWKPEAQAELSPKAPVKSKDAGVILKKLLTHPNIGSKRWVVRQYDHEVQGGSVIKPFAGLKQNGPSDACVFRPQLDTWRGVVISNGINPLYGEIDPYWMAANAIDEALRNLVAVGGDIQHCAILDNFCWGNIHDSHVMAGLVRCSQACYDFATAYGVPFISGKDSLNNTWQEAGKIWSIPGTLLISAISVIEDARKCVSMDLKSPGNVLLLLGETGNEFGGSHFNEVLGLSGGKVPEVNASRSLKFMEAIGRAVDQGLIRSCHDLSEGGLGVAVAEMAFAGQLGAKIDLAPLLPSSSGGAIAPELGILFSETASRWIIEVEPKKLAAVKKCFANLPVTEIGKVEKSPKLTVKASTAKTGKDLFSIQTAELAKAWNSFSNAQ